MNIEYTAPRPAMVVHPEMDDSTGEVLESRVEYANGKEAMMAADLEIEQEQFKAADEVSQETEYEYTIEEVDRLLEDHRDQPDQNLAEISWNTDVGEDPAANLIHVLATRYLASQMTYEEALDAAFSHGFSEQELLRGYQIYNEAYNRAKHGG